MNITFESDKHVRIICEIVFQDDKIYRFTCQHGGYQPLVHTVVGRSPADVREFYLTYGGNRFQLPVRIRPDGEMYAVRLYGGRDHWSEVLREMAIAASDEYDVVG